MRMSRRMDNVTPYLFVEINKKIAEKKALGEEIINFSIGDPDTPTPDNIVEKLCQAAREPINHHYPEAFGLPEFRKAVSGWYMKRFGVELDPESEVLPLIGAKEGIAHIALCFIDAGDIVLVPDPSYPIYNSGTVLAGGKTYYMPLLQKNKFLPELNLIPEDVLKKAKLMWINYPNNPTGAVAELDFYNRVVEFAKKHDIVVCHDDPYSEISFDDYKPASFLQAEGAKDIGVEFHSLSKSYNMAGWRIGMVVGNAQVIKALNIVKSNIDTGIPQAIQYAAIEALNGSQAPIEKRNMIYQRRRDLLIEVLNDIGMEAVPPKAGLYIWAKVPAGYTSIELTNDLLDNIGIVVTPGTGYGECGEGYIRFSLTLSDVTLVKGLSRLSGWKNEKDKFKAKVRK